MEQTIVTSLVIAFISAVTFLAYKHPIAFKRLYWPILFIFFSATFYCGAWNLAIDSTLTALKEHIPPAQFQVASAKAKDLEFPHWHSTAFLVFALYMMFLLWLPEILSSDTKKSKSKEE